MSHKSQTNSYTEFFYKSFRNILIISVHLVIISALALSLPHSFAEVSGSTDNVSLTLSTSCTVSAAVTVAHETSLHGGQKDDNVGNTKLSAFCNDNNGYSIYAVGSSGDTDGNTDLINTVNESYNIRTGVYNNTIQTNPSSWAMKLTAGTGTGIDPVTGESVPTTPPTIVNGYDNYSAIPNVYTQVAKRTSGTSMITDSDTSGSYLNTTYQIYANSYQPAGTYNGKVKYVIVHPNSSHNTIPDIEAAFAAAGKRKTYQDETGKYYYAMQDMTTDICNSISRNGEITSTQLVDLRDNKPYWVTKLKDGHCWMTENLDLDIITYINGQGQEVMKPLTSNDTDLNVAYDSSTGQYAEYNNGYTESNGLIYYAPASSATTINFQNNEPISGWQDSNTTPYTANKTDSAETGHNSLGNYYNWTAVIASNNSSSITENTYSDITNNPNNSVCSRGWRLPTISSMANSYENSTNEFGRLNYIYNDNAIYQVEKIFQTPLYFAQPGQINTSSKYSIDGGEPNNYWSSTINTDISAYYLAFSSRSIDPDRAYYLNSRSRGASVRCVAR